MKRKIAILLSAAMLVSLSAYGNNTGSVGGMSSVEVKTSAIQETGDAGTVQEVSAQGTDNNKGRDDNEVKIEVLEKQVITSSVNTQRDSVGKTLLKDFKKRAKTKSKSPEAIANELLKNQIVAFSGAVVPVKEGMLTGFGNTKITGFSNGVMFGPVIGAIPFVGYVFELKDSTNAKKFVSKLKKNADLRWNICTSADEVVTGRVGKKVFFVMSPVQFEE